ncbi:retrotransposon hot spot (RHS) protein, putative, partial [Trypanosoma cruzi]
RTQEMKFTISTNIEDVLFKGRVRVKEMRLNDFLTKELDGRGIVDTNRDFLLEEFFKEPTEYIRDKGALNEIQASGAYFRMEGAVKGEVIFDEDIRRLCDKGFKNQSVWSLAAAEVKAAVHNSSKHFLDAAAEEARKQTTTSAPERLEGVYESVHNASWSHAVEIPDGVGRKKTGTGMEVREGEPPQPWTYRAVDDTLEKNDGVEQSGAPRSRLMVLTSDKGWPYSWNLKGVESIHDCYVNCEVEQVWRIVLGDLTEWSSPDAGDYFTPERRLLIGTPGIGKSMAAGSYLLYQLLHYDAEQLPMVAYVIGSQSFLFDKTTKTVSTYRGDSRIDDVVKIFPCVG